jgi:hypothetical protein
MREGKWPFGVINVARITGWRDEKIAIKTVIRFRPISIELEVTAKRIYESLLLTLGQDRLVQLFLHVLAGVSSHW